MFIDNSLSTVQKNHTKSAFWIVLLVYQCSVKVVLGFPWQVPLCAGIGMASVQAFNPISALSLSSGGDSDATAEPPPRQKRKSRKRQRQVLEQAVQDETNIRAMLGKPKCHCKRLCLNQFSDDANFAQLKAWREDWCSMHKLDQDQFDSLLCSSKMFLFPDL